MPQHSRSLTRNRPKSPKNPTAPRQAQDATRRIKNAINTARNLLRAFKRGDAKAITEATILQGILSGDVTAASVAVKLKLQRENLRLRQLLTRSRLIGEELKQRITRKQGDLLERTKLTHAQRLDAVRSIYGLNPDSQETSAPTSPITNDGENPPATNAGENAQENPSTFHQDAPPQADR